jgi:hypothetical protein
MVRRKSCAACLGGQDRGWRGTCWVGSMTRARLLSPMLCTTILLSACGDDGSDETETATATVGASSTTGDPTGSVPTSTTGDDPPAARPNWHEDIAPVAAKHCGSCHYDGGIAPFSVASYEGAKPWAPAMAANVELALMPPWHAVETDECTPPFGFKHDARLGDDVKQLFIDWADNGAPEGDPKLAAPIPDPPSLDLANPNKTALMQSAVTLPAAGQVRDYFNCLSIDPGNAETVYLDGMQVIAGNRSIVHHVLIYVDAKGDSAKWAGGKKLDCGGGPGGVAGAQLVAGWVPGGMPIEPPPGVGTEMPPGTRLIMNVHYHAAATEQQDDATGLALRWKTAPPAWSSLFVLVGDPGFGTSLTGELMIPAGAKDHVEEYTWKVGLDGKDFPDLVDVRLWAALNHMHKVGVDLKVWIEDRDSGEETCLLQTPRWDFNWQRSYAYDTPIESAFRLRSGDTVRVRCTYDNTLNNSGVQELLAEVGLKEPVDITLGEGTLNEMCITGLGVAVKGGL